MGHEPQPWTQLIALRGEARLTQTQLAERTGITQETISAYETGRRRPAAFNFTRLQAVFPSLALPARPERTRKAAA
jgi:transcriptional regulator with XRE-family HTH domain